MNKIKSKPLRPQTIIPRRLKKNLPKSWEVDFRIAFGIGRNNNVTEDSIKSLSHKMIQWVKSKKTIYTFKPFLNFQNILHPDFLEWTDKYPFLKADYKFAKQIISENRENAALNKTISEKTMFFMQGVYDAQWKKQEQYFNDLKVKANSALATPAEYAAITKKMYDEIPGAIGKVPEQAYEANKTKEVKSKD